MLNGPEGFVRKYLVVGASGLFLSLLAWSALGADTIVKLVWDKNQELDLSGYLLYYGASSGNYGPPVNLLNVTNYDIHGLDPNTTYYFAVKAYDHAGNVSAFSNQVSAKPTTLIGTPPTITSVIETMTNSIYILQPGRHTIRVVGANFQAGATVDLGSGITAGPTSLTGSTQLTTTIDVAATATLGPRTLTVTNPDGGTGSLGSALSLRVVRTPDINRDCRVDSTDLNLIAQIFSKSSADAGFDPATDLDGSGVVDGADLTIWAEYFGLPLAICP